MAARARNTPASLFLTTRKTLVDLLVYLLVRLLVCVVQSVRIETCAGLARLIAWFATEVFFIRGKIVLENLRHAFPQQSPQQLRRLNREMWEHLILLTCEIAHAPRKIHRTNWHQYVRVHRKREFVKMLLDPRPRLIVSGHFGNFEFGGFITGLLGFPTYTVARQLDNPYVDRYVNRFRSLNGQFIVPKKDSAGQIERLLANGEILTLLGDQHAGTKGCWVDFFGRPASCHKAIALFSLTQNAPMLVSYAKRDRCPMHFEIGATAFFDPASCESDLDGVRPLTQWYNDQLERLIRKSPAQYWWLHRRWRDPPKRLSKGNAKAARAA